MNNTKLMESTISDLREDSRGEFAFKVKGYEVILLKVNTQNNNPIGLRLGGIFSV